MMTSYPDGFGRRARFGLIYIASAIVMEPECCAMAPDGVWANQASFWHALRPAGYHDTVSHYGRLLRL